MSEPWTVNGKTHPTSTALQTLQTTPLVDGACALKIIWSDGEVVEDGDRSRPNAQWTLSKFYDWGRREGLFGEDPRTDQVHRVAAARFDRLVESPALGDIDRAKLQRWVDRLKKEPGRDGSFAPASIDKEWRTVRHILREAKEYQCCDAPRRPKLPPLDEPEPREVALDEMRRLYQAADQLDWPRLPGTVKTVDWWRGMLVYVWNTGVRPQHWMGLEWQHVDLDRGEVQASRDIDKVKRRRWFALHPTVVEHLRRLQPDVAAIEACAALHPERADEIRGIAKLVFPLFDRVRGRRNDRQQFYRCWWRLLESAGFKKGELVCKNVRQTTGSILKDLCGVDVAVATLGHSPAIFDRHYDTRKKQRRRDAAEQMPQFTAGAPAGKQRTFLFGD